MSYSAVETSVHSGAPAELYLFSHGGQVYGYTSATRALTVASQLYVPTPIERTKVRWTTKLTGGKLLIDVPVDFPIALLFDGFPPETPVSLTIYRYHVTDVDEESVIVWAGRVRSASWQEDKAVLSCDSFATTLNKTGPRLQYQYMCNHVLYGIPCGISETTFSVNTTLYSISGLNLYSTALASYDDGWFSGGYFRFNNKYRMITSHIGDQITVTALIDQLTSSSSITVSAGCSHTFDTCVDKFSNSRRYGGYPFVPNRNPFVIGL